MLPRRQAALIAREVLMERIFPFDRLLEKARNAGGAWHEFLRVADLSMGLYLLKAGSDDSQTPHAEDEVYYVVRGRGSLRVAERDHEVRKARSCLCRRAPSTVSIPSAKTCSCWCCSPPPRARAADVPCARLKRAPSSERPRLTALACRADN